MKKENIKKYIAISMIFISSIIGIYHYYNNIHKTNLEKESAEVFIEETVMIIYLVPADLLYLTYTCWQKQYTQRKR